VERKRREVRGKREGEKEGRRLGERTGIGAERREEGRKGRGGKGM